MWLTPKPLLSFFLKIENKKKIGFIQVSLRFLKLSGVSALGGGWVSTTNMLGLSFLKVFVGGVCFVLTTCKYFSSSLRGFPKLRRVNFCVLTTHPPFVVQSVFLLPPNITRVLLRFSIFFTFLRFVQRKENSTGKKLRAFVTRRTHRSCVGVCLQI